MVELTQKRLKELLEYNPDTGEFVWLAKQGSRGVKGSVAGCANPFGYVVIKTDSQGEYAHRLAFLYMEGSIPIADVDHVNHNTSDNRWCNLRHATKTVNQRNRTHSKNNTSGFTGVHRHPTGKWQSGISINNKLIYLGLFMNLSDAVRVRIDAEIKYGFHHNHGS